jgi:hypothetical protein
MRSLTIKDIFNGVLQESKSGGPLVGLGTDLLIGSSKQTGFLNKSFDEVRITLIICVSKFR